MPVNAEHPHRAADLHEQRLARHQLADAEGRNQNPERQPYDQQAQIRLVNFLSH